MGNLDKKISSTKKKYREIFERSAEHIQNQIEALKPKEAGFLGEIFDKFEQNSLGEKWQRAVLKFFDEEVSKDIFDRWTKILAYRKNFSCAGCATCCKLACSEFSPQALTEKAAAGDNFATQFTSIFVPYATKDEARKVYPEYFVLIDEKLGENEEIYFYHCPKLGADNRCTDYENRPQICRDFPDNPLSLLPRACGWARWKDEVEPTALMLHGIIEITQFYRERLKELL